MKRLSVLLGLGLMASSAWGDIVVLANGDRLSGTVDSISSGRLLLITDYAGTVPIKTDMIAQLSTDDEFDLVTDEGRVAGQFDVINGAQVVVAEAATTPVAITSIRTAGQNKLALASLAADWSSRADLSAVVSSGNSSTESYNALVESVLQRDNVEHSLSILINNEEAEQIATKEQLDVDYGYKRFISEKWYAAGNAEYFEDQLKDIDQRITLGAGMGYQFWQDSFGAFSTDLSLNYVREELAGEQESNPAVRWGLDYQRYLFAKKLEFFHGQSILFIPDSDRGEVLESSTGLRYALNDRIDTAVRVDVDHETDPAPGNSKTDVTYTLGVGIKF